MSRKIPRIENAGEPSEADQTVNAVLDESTSEISEPFLSNYDILYVNGDIDYRLWEIIFQCVNDFRQHDNVILIIVTYGGVANEAYRIARYLQSVYDDVVAFVPSICKSAGTLVVAAASRLLMGSTAEIGPLDVQLRQRDELSGRRSGLTTRSALSDLKTHTLDIFENFMLSIIRRSAGAISFRLAADISARDSSDVMSKVYEQINPDTIGQDFRDLNVAMEYCERLNKRFKNLRRDAIRRLVHNYPSHDFIIDLEEARELFERVDLPTPLLWQIALNDKWDMMSALSRNAMVQMLTIDGRAISDEKQDSGQRAGNGGDPVGDSPRGNVDGEASAA